MQITTINYFEPINLELSGYMPYEDIKTQNLLDNYQEFPDFIVVENQLYEDEIIITNEHWYMNPNDDLSRTTYSQDTKLVGVWNVIYKSA